MPVNDLTTVSPQPRSGWNGQWYPDPATPDRLAQMAQGSRLMIRKRRPNGSDAALYPGTLVESRAPAPWIEIRAVWDEPVVHVTGLTFEPGDVHRQFFSAVHPFNAFAFATANGIHKGWYANVTFPAFLLDDDTGITLVWHDLYLDVVVLPDGIIHLLDDDELDAAPAPFSEPAMYRAIHGAREDLIAFVQSLDVKSEGTIGSG